MRIMHTMIRVGDLERSIEFYTNAFVGYDDEARSAGWNLRTIGTRKPTTWEPVTAMSRSRSTLPPPPAMPYGKWAEKSHARPDR